MRILKSSRHLETFIENSDTKSVFRGLRTPLRNVALGKCVGRHAKIHSCSLHEKTNQSRGIHDGNGARHEFEPPMVQEPRGDRSLGCTVCPRRSGGTSCVESERTQAGRPEGGIGPIHISEQRLRGATCM